MKIKIESSKPISSFQQPQKGKSKAQKLPVKRQRVILSDSNSSDEDTIPLTMVLQKDKRTKKRQDSKPP